MARSAAILCRVLAPLLSLVSRLAIAVTIAACSFGNCETKGHEKSHALSVALIPQ